jgi:predicted nucleic acid-binding protein
MRVYVDTSAIDALLVGSDRNHAAARAAFLRLREMGAALTTSSYVVLESWALLLGRHGPRAAADLEQALLPLMAVRWVDQAFHRRIAARVLARATDRGPSLVDEAGFAQMEEDGIDHALAFDAHFASRGYGLPE